MENINHRKQSERAIELQQRAKIKRDTGKLYDLQHPGKGHLFDMEAEELEADARGLLTPQHPVEITAGKEVLPPEKAEDESTGLSIRDTLLEASQIGVDTSRDRLELASKAGCLLLAVDTAESINARNSLEKMLAHQLAACHSASMSLISKTKNLSERESDIAVKLINASARLMDTFQRGLATLAKIRNGGRQTVTVKHVSVNQGGRAIVGAVSQNRGGSNDRKEQ